MIRITVSPEALERAGGSAAVAIAKTGASLKNITVLKDGTAVLKGRRKNPARGRAGGPQKPKKGKGSYSRKAGKAVSL
jgi:hypothetical protein